VTTDDYSAAMHEGSEVFQPLFNAIANDLASFRGSLNRDELINIRRMGRLRFGADLAPDAFAQFIQRNDDGRYKLVRLPAKNDPMYARIMKIRERDLMLVDTLSQHMENFHGNMKTSYAQWRQMRTEEATQMREIQHQANKRKLLGIGAIAAAIGAQILGGGSPAVNTASNVLVVGGMVAIKSGFDKAGETDIHKAAIEELGDSFASDTRPMTVEVEGKTIELSGSAEAQYAEWRTLLRDIYSSESGLSTADVTDGA